MKSLDLCRVNLQVLVLKLPIIGDCQMEVLLGFHEAVRTAVVLAPSVP